MARLLIAVQILTYPLKIKDNNNKLIDSIKIYDLGAM